MRKSRFFPALFIGAALALPVIAVLAFRSWHVRQLVPILIEDLQASILRMNEEPGGKAHDDNFSSAIAAMYQLGGLGPRASPAVPLLIEALEGPERHYRNGDRTLRGQAGSALAGIGPDAVGPLIGSLDHSDPQVRKLAARALGEIAKQHPGKAAPAVIPLANVTEDEDAVVRMCAIEALWSFGPAARSALPALTRALEDDNSEVRDFARHAIAQIDPEAKARDGMK